MPLLGLTELHRENLFLVGKVARWEAGGKILRTISLTQLSVKEMGLHEARSQNSKTLS